MTFYALAEASAFKTSGVEAGCIASRANNLDDSFSATLTNYCSIVAANDSAKSLTCTSTTTSNSGAHTLA